VSTLESHFPEIVASQPQLLAHHCAETALNEKAVGYRLKAGQLLHGTKPSELPIQRPERFDLVINLNTAATLGLDMPAQLQQLADEVIE
jgi:ABC-type uncharacterized transport system substrate-binding protein